jgi:DNA-binding response OmpR family regulator
MRILIAEDDEALAKFVRQGLEGEHYSVNVVSDGEQARAAALELAYDVVVLDLNLPKLDGVSVLRQLRLKKPSLPVLILTQRTKVEDRVQCLDTGRTIIWLSRSRSANFPRAFGRCCGEAICRRNLCWWSGT